MITVLILGLQSCRKGPGPGGKARIEGKVYVQEYNSTWSVLLAEYYIGDEDVFIVYGDDITFADKVSTHYDGTFEFRYLLPGTYTIFVYSKDKSGTEPSGTVVVQKTVEITDRKQEIVLDDFVIEDN